jgi:membrane-bound lytic murein transglycosylase B
MPAQVGHTLLSEHPAEKLPMLLLRPLPLCTLMTLSLLGACSSLGPRPASQPAPVVSIILPPPQSEAPTAAQAQAILPRLAPQAMTLPVNPTPNSYAFRDDARALAIKLASKYQLDESWAISALTQAQVNDTVTKLIMPAAAPTAKNWAVYRSRFVEPIRIRAGVAFWRANEATLRRAQDIYGIPMDIIVGIIGVETIYGRNTGNFRILDALSTLSLDFPKGRSDRSAFFQDELGQFLRLCAEQGDNPTSVLGSYAGAIGLPQFMPSSIRRLAIDFDGDGHIDLRNSQADAIGSVANYLARNGWQKNTPTHYSVAPPKDAGMLGTLLGPDILPTFTASQLQQQGALLDEAGQNHVGKLALVMLYNGDLTPTYLAGTENFYAITRYNQSSYYALAVIELGQAVAKAVRNGEQ